MDSNESLWRRGRKDTVKAAKSFPFIIAEVGGAAMIGIISQDPWISLIYFTGLLAALFLGATVTAPVRQRNEERAQRVQVEDQLAGNVPPITKFDWKPWQVRRQFTIREVGSLMAGVEPSLEGTHGAANAYTQELLWDIENEELAIVLSQHQHTFRRLSAGLGSTKMPAEQNDIVTAKTLKEYLAKRNDVAAREALSNLGEHELLQSLPKPE